MTRFGEPCYIASRRISSLSLRKSRKPRHFALSPCCCRVRRQY